MQHNSRRFLFKYLIIFLLTISLVNISCYSYYEVAVKDLTSSNHQTNIKIEKKDKSSIEGKLKDVNSKDSLLVVQKKSTQQFIPYAEIEKLFLEKINAGESMVMVPVVIIGVIGFVALLLYISMSNGTISGSPIFH